MSDADVDRESDLESIRRWGAERALLATDVGSLGSLVRATGMRRVMLVVDRGAADANRAMPRLRAALGSSLVEVFCDFSPNPDADQACAAADLARLAEADGVIAFGGGSSIDVAKLAALALAEPDRTRLICEGRVSATHSPRPVIAVPTTSGTGSEATRFAAVYVRGEKVSISHPDLRPKAVVMDVRLHATCPPRIAAASGLDALCQFMESLWALGSTPESRQCAGAAGRVIAPWLESSVLEGGRVAREAMMWGSHAAGLAIDTSRTTAPHALSYALTSRFGLPHGLAVALTIARFAVVNVEADAARCRDPRGVEWIRARTVEAAGLLGVRPYDLPARVWRMLRRLGCPATLSEAGVPRDDLDDLASRVDSVRLSNHPVSFTHEQLVSLLEAAW